MTTNEALETITASVKWYRISNNEKECTHLRVMAMRIQNGTAKEHTVRQFFSKFGYAQNEVTWRKV